MKFINHEEGRVIVETHHTTNQQGQCVPCDQLKTKLTNYTSQYGQQALSNMAQLTGWLNAALPGDFTQSEYTTAISQCNLMDSYLNFNGGYVSFGQQPQYQMGTIDFTIEAWVRYPSTLNNGNVVYAIVANQDYLGGNTAFTGFNLQIFQGKLFFVVGDGSDYSAINANVLPTANTWHHVVAQRVGNQASAFKIFVNGVEAAKTIYRQGLTDGNIDQDGIESLKIGSRQGSYDNGTFLGDIKQVRIYKRVLSESEISSSYNNGCSANPSNTSQLMLWVPVNEGTGTVVTDLSSYHQSGNFINNTLTWNNSVKQCVNNQNVLCRVTENVYQYHLKDHLGNVRVTFTTKDETEENTATVETANLDTERSKFLNIDKARRINSAIFDHTYNNQPRPADGAYAVRLSGTSAGGYTREKYGLARTLSVMPGDKINLEVYAKYVDLSNSGVDAALKNLVMSIAANTATPGTVVDGASYASNSASGFSYGNYLDKTSETDPGPKAYLNYLVFDKDFNFIKSKSGYKRVTTAARENGVSITDITTAEGSSHEQLSASIDITEAGFVYIYLSNEETTPVEVYFDDFKVTQVKSPVIQVADYYPFGLTLNEAVDYIFSTNKWINESKDQIENVKFKLNATLKLLGDYAGSNLITKKSVGDHLTLYTYMIRYDRQPLRFSLLFYKPSNQWRLFNFSYDDTLDEELKEAAKAYRLKENLPQ